MKKRMVSALLVSAMVLSVVGCGSKDAAADTTTDAAAEETADTDDESTTETADAAGDVNATVIWRAFDDQFQSGFRIIMDNQAKELGGIKLDMQDAANDVSTANNKLDAALTK